jgi:glycosyltransferase involved in cell wall biosynthesis
VSDRLRLLVVLPFVPRYDAAHGGGRATAGLLRELTRRHDVALVYVRNEKEEALDREVAARCVLVSEIPRAHESRRGVWENRARQLRKLAGAPPALVDVAFVPGAEERIRDVVRAFGPDVVQIELAETAQYLPALDYTRACRVLVDHDPGIQAALDFSAATSGAKRLFRWLDVLAWRRYMRMVVPRLDAVVVFSEPDRALVARESGVDATVIPLTLDPGEPLDPRGADPPRVLFFGGFRHPPNAAAALELVSLYPRLRARRPEALLDLVGADPTPEMTAAAGRGITVTGRVESMLPFLDRAAVVAAPIRHGGGTRVKVLETLAAGKALVATSRAVAGLSIEPGREFLLAETDDELVDALERVLVDVELRMSLGRAARAWAERSMGWESVADAYDALYARLRER